MLIPFSRLYLSDANVRKTRSEEDDIQLSADIEARGLLQNLLVTKSKKRGKFAVIAGGRRLRAIEMIVTRGAWAPDTEIECKLLEGSEEEAGEASLAENFQRVGMSPAEECRAFQHFIKEGSDVAAVAKRFGLTQRFVEGRLRLANLAEPIFEALAKGDVTLEIAKAYAATDQHEVQLRVFEQMRYAYALDWRNRCYRQLRLKERKIADGDMIRLPEPMKFTDGSEHAEFRVTKRGAKIELSTPDGRGRFRISRLMERRFEVVPPKRAPRTFFPATP